MFKLVFIAVLLVSTNLSAATVDADELSLRKLNVEITEAEDRGDGKWLAGVIGSTLAFRRASGVVVGREQFLKDVKPREPSKTEIESVKVFGKDRALVTCIVTVKVDGRPTNFHNVRLFVREGSDWKLLAWANERATK